MGRYKVLHAATFVFIAVLIGCENNQYEFKEDKSGRTIRLNKRTGDIAILVNDKLIPIKNPANENIDSLLSIPKIWPTIENVAETELSASLKTSWRDDLLYYQFELIPKIETTNSDASAKEKDQQPVTDPELIARLDALSEKAEKSTEKAINDLSRKTLTLILYDKHGFKVVEILLSQFTRRVDNKGKPFALEANESYSCSIEKYKSIDSWNLTWRSF